MSNVTIKDLFTTEYSGISGRALCVVHDDEEEKFYQMVKDTESFDFSVISRDKVGRAYFQFRWYFFSDLCPESRIKKFLKLYNNYGRSLVLE